METKVIVKHLYDFVPNVFIDIHSGTNAFLLPYTSRAELVSRNIDKIMPVLKEANQRYCHECEYGDTPKVIHYRAFGTSMDYVYDTLDADVSMGMEIFGGPRYL